MMKTGGRVVRSHPVPTVDEATSVRVLSTRGSTISHEPIGELQTKPLAREGLRQSRHKTQESMDKPINQACPPADPLTFPLRRGLRPTTIHGPLHVQVDGHGDDALLRELIEEVAAWPGVEAWPSPIGSSDLVSRRLDTALAGGLEPVFITDREFGRVLFGAPTIYLALPLNCAHWALVRGWAEPHFSSSLGLMPPGVMVIYTPR